MITAKRDGCDHLQAAVASDVLIRCECRGSGDVSLDPTGRRYAFHDVLHGFDRLVGQGFALVTGQVHLDVGGPAVVALYARPGQRIAPHILNVLNVFGIGVELSDDLVVIGVGLVAEGTLALQHDHDRAVGLVLVEHRSHALCRDNRLRVVG